MSTLDQRQAALGRANDTRQRRAQLKRDIRAGQVAIDELLADPPAWLRNATVFEVLVWIPRIGRYKASQMLRHNDIAAATTLERLTPHRRRNLTDELMQWMGRR